MKITQTYNDTDTIRQLSPEELAIGQQVLTTNMGLKPEESLLIVTDPTMETKEAAIWFEAGKTITQNTSMIVFSGMNQNAQEPPKPVTQAMLEPHVLMLQTSYSLSHTLARKAATQHDSRIASLPTVTTDIILRTMGIDYQPITDLSIKVADALTAAQTAHITSPAGTDITLGLQQRAAIDDGGLTTAPGDFGNLPAGEAFIAPMEGTTNGVFVVDGAFADIDLDAPITFQVESGMVTNISGNQAAEQLNQILAKLPPEAKNIAELGVGTNPAANPKGLLIEAEKAHGTVHIALGKNNTYGGQVDVPFHSDGVILSPTLTLDNQVIIKDGQFSPEL